MIDRMFDRIDADGDGSISAEEFQAAEARWQQRADRRAERRGERLERQQPQEQPQEERQQD
jgi:Ca2+-binding EF-hand superfamily protein